jgi:hypothetical protein
MGKKGHPYAKIFGAALLAVVIGGGALFYIFSGGLPKFPQQSTLTTQQSCIAAGGQWSNGQCSYQPAPQGYVSFTLNDIYMTVMNALDKDATFGADDATVRAYEQGKFDFVGSYLDSDGNAVTSGQIDLAGDRLQTGTCYTGLAYQGDGGTNLYAELFHFCIPQLIGDKTYWSYPNTIFMTTEGAYTESALDSSTAAFDESGDTVTLNKTAETVQGCLSWDFTYSNSVAGSVLRDPVIMFEDSASDPLTDLNDIEEVYLSVKTGSGFSFPSGNLRSEFLSATPVSSTSDGELGSADGGTGTLKVCLPAEEADVGTGDILMHFDDLGDYRSRDLDNDVRAAAETTTFSIET